MAESFELEPIGPYRVHLRPAPSQDVYASATPTRTGPEIPVSVVRSRRAPEPPASDVSFRRFLFAPMDECLARLAGWGDGSTSQCVGRSRVVMEPPLSLNPARCRLSVLLHRRLRSRARMELSIEQSCAPFGTQLTLRPVGEVRTGRRYFREGNAVLNCVEDLLEDDPSATPTRPD
jgi:hypothetical protein